MRIDNSGVKLIFEFKCEDYFLVNCEKETNGLWPYSLNYRIDRSEKGKCDDIGIAKIYLDEKEAEQAKQAGFSYIDF